MGALASSIATRLQNGVSVTQLSAGQPFVFIPYPQFTSLNVLDSNDFSTYHALEAQLTRRLSRGISFNVAYTWAKALDTRSFDPTLTVVGTGNCIHRRRHSVRHQQPPPQLRATAISTAATSSSGTWSRSCPSARASTSCTAPAVWWIASLGGWEVTGLRPRHQRPSLHRLLRHQHREQREPVHRQLHAAAAAATDRHSPRPPPACSGIFDAADRAKFSAPGAGQFGNTGRNFFIGPHWFEIDSSLLKRIAVNERVKLEVRADATNLTNTPSFGGPTTDITSSTFGRIRNTVSSSSRKIQLGAKIHF